jgi:hypothetical protein
MNRDHLRRLRRVLVLRGFRTPFVLLALVGLATAAVAAGLAFARSRAVPVGTGVVVDDTDGRRARRAPLPRRASLPET